MTYQGASFTHQHVLKLTNSKNNFEVIGHALEYGWFFPEDLYKKIKEINNYYEYQMTFIVLVLKKGYERMGPILCDKP